VPLPNLHVKWPAHVILLAGLGAYVVVGLGLLALDVPNRRVGLVASSLFAATVIFLDVRYRRRYHLTLWDRSRSTWWFLLPTWTFGVFVLGVGAFCVLWK
jgi:hypothetical protein